MDSHIKELLWNQFGAAIDMLENAIIACPENLWNQQQFWYSAYHCLFFLDYYSTVPLTNFHPPKPFNLDELSPEGILPDRIYTQKEMLDYLQYGRQKCFELINGLNSSTINNRFTNYYIDFNVFEILLDNMRHVQHHAAQLNLLLRQETNGAPKWVAQTKTNFQITNNK